MTREWAQFWTAAAVAFVSGTTAFLASIGWNVGSMGEWISGVGALAAVIVALRTADRQRQHAAEMLEQERAHSASSLAEERRYQETLAKMAEEEAVRARAAEQYHWVNWIASHVGAGLFAAASALKEMEQCDDDQARKIANGLLTTHAFALASRTLDRVGPATFSSYVLTLQLNDVLSMWLNIAQPVQWFAENPEVSRAEMSAKIALQPFKEPLVKFVATGHEHLRGLDAARSRAQAEAWFDFLMSGKPQ